MRSHHAHHQDREQEINLHTLSALPVGFYARKIFTTNNSSKHNAVIKSFGTVSRKSAILIEATGFVSKMPPLTGLTGGC
jgi:hypothetical protein